MCPGKSSQAKKPAVVQTSDAGNFPSPSTPPLKPSLLTDELPLIPGSESTSGTDEEISESEPEFEIMSDEEAAGVISEGDQLQQKSVVDQ